VQRVLVAEDEEVVRKFLQEALRAGFGCSVQASRSGADALRMTEKEDFALVISDVRMAGMNGPEFYRRLSERRPEMADRFVFVTGHEGEAGLRALLAQCDVPLLKKPFTMERLQEICGPILQRGRAAK
jgi:CheY-like chemotaxis protein